MEGDGPTDEHRTDPFEISSGTCTGSLWIPSSIIVVEKVEQENTKQKKDPFLAEKKCRWIEIQKRSICSS